MEEDYGSKSNKEIGKRIKEIREFNGLTQEQMAEILKVNPNAIRGEDMKELSVSFHRLHTYIAHRLFDPIFLHSFGTIQLPFLLPLMMFSFDLYSSYIY